MNPLPETDLAILIAAITDDPEDYLWINAKSTNATTIQAEINSKKPAIPLEDQIPKEFHGFWTSSLRKTQRDSPNLDPGITRLS